ncbi:MAG TPA: hypothetical protein PLL53_18035, partial [Saprospiraceae bacterium]|nr:hypothetical protein [Saprospiraceae bacterium]
MKIPIIILLAVSLWNCTFPEENERIKLNFTPITQYGLIDIYSEEVIDSNLLLFTKENGILIVEPNLFVRQADDLGSKWKFTWSRNDSLFVGKDPEHYFYAKIIDQKLIVDTAQTHEYTFLPEMPFYEDDDYIMTKCCQGEFGGAVFMKSKKTPQWERAIDATCPIQVIKKGQNSYYIVTYLGHLSSHSTIIQINDINNINRYPILDPTYCSYFIQYYFLGNDGNRPDISYDSLQSKILGKGNHVILDTIGTHILKGNLTP